MRCVKESLGEEGKKAEPVKVNANHLMRKPVEDEITSHHS
jgi:hypothetical protein